MRGRSEVEMVIERRLRQLREKYVRPFVIIMGAEERRAINHTYRDMIGGAQPDCPIVRLHGVECIMSNSANELHVIGDKGGLLVEYDSQGHETLRGVVHDMLSERREEAMIYVQNAPDKPERIPADPAPREPIPAPDKPKDDKDK